MTCAPRPRGCWACDTQCRNTVAVLITGGGEGTGGHVPSASSIASTFLTVTAGRRVPIYVIAIAPPATAVAELQAIATNSGGRYFEITKAQIDLAAANYVAVPEMVSAITAAVQHGFAQPTDFNTAPTAQLPYGPQSEFQVTSPIVGTVNLKNSVSITGATLPNTDITNPTSGAEIPQRGNVDDHRRICDARLRRPPARVPDVQAGDRHHQAVRLQVLAGRHARCGWPRRRWPATATTPPPVAATSSRSCPTARRSRSTRPTPLR